MTFIWNTEFQAQMMATMGAALSFSLKADPSEAMADYIAASLHRLQQARSVADSLRHDAELHRLAMMAVFVLEDCHEMLSRFGEPCETELDRSERA